MPNSCGSDAEEVEALLWGLSMQGSGSHLENGCVGEERCRGREWEKACLSQGEV